MATNQDKIHFRFISDILGQQAQRKLQRLRPRKGELTSVPRAPEITASVVNQRWEQLQLPESSRGELLEDYTLGNMESYQKNIEDFIGTVKLPVGIAGPLKCERAACRGSYYVPLATTEAALVASYSRGAHLISLAGGCAAAVMAEAGHALSRICL